MFGFFKKVDKKETLPVEKELLYSPANGIVVPVSDVADPVFSQKMMGDGFAVIPTDGNIFSPAKGKVLSVFPTKHAVGILLDSGLELLLHMGLDTVELNGKPFEVFVKEGQALTADTLIAKVDLAQLQEAGKDSAMVVVITNMDKVKSFSLDVTGEAAVKAEIGGVLPNEYQKEFKKSFIRLAGWSFLLRYRLPMLWPWLNGAQPVKDVPTKKSLRALCSRCRPALRQAPICRPKRIVSRDQRPFHRKGNLRRAR